MGGVDDELKAGDVVRLKSGGPPMTVRKCALTAKSLVQGVPDLIGFVVCDWFDVNQRYSAEFAPEQVERVLREVPHDEVLRKFGTRRPAQGDWSA